MSNSSFKIKHGLNVSGNVVVTGNVDGRDLVIDGNKLDNIEVGATADQSATEIKTAYESNAGVESFTSTLKSKLDGIATSANNYSPPQAIATSSNVTFNDVTVSGTLTETSAAIYKENINPLASQLANVMALRPVEYDKKATGEHEIGLIAGEVEKVLPDFVQMKNGVADSLNYSRMVSVLVKAVQELTEKVEKLSK